VTVRPAVPADEPAVVGCVNAAYQMYVEVMGKRPAPMLGDYGSLIARGVVSVATQTRTDRVIGLIVMWPKQDHLYVDNIAVHPSVQGSGVGAGLLAHADSEAARCERDEIRLYTNVAMRGNIDYYPRRGFVETHRAVDEGYERVYFSRKLGLPPGGTVDS